MRWSILWATQPYLKRLSSPCKLKLKRLSFLIDRETQRAIKLSEQGWERTPTTFFSPIIMLVQLHQEGLASMISQWALLITCDGQLRRKKTFLHKTNIIIKARANMRNSPHSYRAWIVVNHFPDDHPVIIITYWKTAKSMLRVENIFMVVKVRQSRCSWVIPIITIKCREGVGVDVVPRQGLYLDKKLR